MAWLPDGKNSLKIRLFVLTEFTNVTDTQTDRQTDITWRHRPRLHSIARHKLRTSEEDGSYEAERICRYSTGPVSLPRYCQPIRVALNKRTSSIRHPRKLSVPQTSSHVPRPLRPTRRYLINRRKLSLKTGLRRRTTSDCTLSPTLPADDDGGRATSLYRCTWLWDDEAAALDSVVSLYLRRFETRSTRSCVWSRPSYR